jgi:uncharacterized protein YukE
VSQWTEKNVGAGDPGSVLSSAATLDSIVASLATLSGETTTTVASVDAATWRGAAGDAYRSRGAAVATDLRTFAEDLTRYSGALSAYASRVSRIASDAAELYRRRAGAQQELDDARQRIRMADDPAAAQDALRQRQSATTAKRHLDAELDALVTTRRNADATLQAVLAVAPRTSFALLGRALVSAGVGRPTQLTKSGLTALLLDLTAKVERGEATAHDVDVLGALLATVMINPARAGAYLQDLGGTRLTALLVALDVLAAKDPARAGAIREVQSRLRSTLATASLTWDKATCDRFARDLMVGTNAAVAVAYLFGDPATAPMGERLVFAMADTISAWERANDRMFTMLDSVDRDGRPTSLMASTLSTFGRDEFGMLIVDPADSVLRHVALYPELALGWLTYGRNLEYWFDTRDWASSSGHNAPAIVWASIQTVPGALIGPDMDPALVRQLAEVNTAIILAWSDEVLKGKSHFTEDGLLALGEVVAAQLPAWLEVTINETFRDDGTAMERAFVDWMGQSGDCAVISHTDLAGLLRLIQPDARASGAVLATIRSLSESVVSAVPAGGGRNDFEISLRKSAALLALIDGGGLANDLSARAARDRLASLAIDSVGAAGSSALGAITGPLAATVIEQGATSAAADAFANSYQARLDEYWSGGSPGDVKRYDEARDVLRHLAETHLPPAALEASGEDVEALIRQVMTGYDHALTWVGMTR